MERNLFEADHEAFRSAVQAFGNREVAPNLERWDAQHSIDRDVWLAAGKQGIIGLSVPEELGGGGQSDYRYRVVVTEELARLGANSLNSMITVHEELVLPYLNDLGTPEQKKRWLPGMASGELIGAIAMTEPGAGSDLKALRTAARRDGGEWVIEGQKTFISNGMSADVVIVAVRTEGGDAGAHGLSLIVVEKGTHGFTYGRKLEKIGLNSQDTVELVFEDVRVPADHLLGEEGKGFAHLMDRLPRERIAIATLALSTAQAAFDYTAKYCTARQAFGKAIIDFQNSRFVLAEIATDLDAARAYHDACVLALNASTFSAVDAAKVKWWTTELENKILDRCLQLHGGYGYMLEYPIARAFIDSRPQTIYGGTTEIMKEIIGRDIAATYR